MERDIAFSERQKFSQWWIWGLILGLNGLIIYAFLTQVIGDKPFGNNPMSDTGLVATMGLTALVTLLLLSIRLHTRIDLQGIHVRLYPFHFQYKRYSWDQLANCYVRKYSPIMEYGGWGIRIGLFGKGMAYNISGNQGLQLEFRSGKKLLIGTNKPTEIALALEKFWARSK